MASPNLQEWLQQPVVSIPTQWLVQQLLAHEKLKLDYNKMAAQLAVAAQAVAELTSVQSRPQTRVAETQTDAEPRPKLTLKLKVDHPPTAPEQSQLNPPPTPSVLEAGAVLNAMRVGSGEKRQAEPVVDYLRKRVVREVERELTAEEAEPLLRDYIGNSSPG